MVGGAKGEFEWTGELSQALEGLSAATNHLMEAVGVVREVTRKISTKIKEQEDNVRVMQDELAIAQWEAEKKDEERRAYWASVEKRIYNNLNSKVIVDVGGKQFTTTKATLLKHKGSYFEEVLTATQEKEIFIDRNPKLFVFVLEFLRTGKLFVDSTTPKAALVEEFTFFRLPLPEELGAIPPAVVAAPSRVVVPAPSIEVAASPTTLLSPTTYQALRQRLSSSKPWELIFQASRHGFHARDFTERCTGKSPTLAVIKVKETAKVFGICNNIAWSNKKSANTDRNAFLFAQTDTNPRFFVPKLLSDTAFLADNRGLYNSDVSLFNPWLDARAGACNAMAFKSLDNGEYSDTTLAGRPKFTVEDMVVFVV